MYAGHNQNWYAYHLYRYYHFFTAFSFGGADARRANDRCSPGQFSKARSQSINARTQVQSTRDVWTCCGGHGHPQKEPSKGETMPKCYCKGWRRRRRWRRRKPLSCVDFFVFGLLGVILSTTVGGGRYGSVGISRSRREREREIHSPVPESMSDKRKAAADLPTVPPKKNGGGPWPRAEQELSTRSRVHRPVCNQIGECQCNQNSTHTTCVYHIPIPVNYNQKTGKYRYDTGKTTPLSGMRWHATA